MIVADKPMRGESLSKLPLRDLSLYELGCVYAYLACTLPQGEYDPNIAEVIREFDERNKTIVDHGSGECPDLQDCFNEGYNTGYDDGYSQAASDVSPVDTDERM